MTIDPFCGYGCLYGDDCRPEAVETFSFNHPEARGDARDIEVVNAAQLRARVGLKIGTLDALVGGPPCHGGSINASIKGEYGDAVVQ